MKKYLSTLFNKTFSLNEKNISEIIKRNGKSGKWLDLGCDDGTWTSEISDRTDVDWYGVDIAKERVDIAAKKGINATVSSLEKELPYDDNTFDLVHSNQVIEHLFDIDLFVKEIYRVLKPGGLAVISTENPASWHNIAALILGYQMFSATNISTKKLGIGNPFALHAGEQFSDTAEGRTSAWAHNKLLTPRALADMMELYGFSVIDKMGSGYYPLPPQAAMYDINHSHFYAIAGNAKK